VDPCAPSRDSKINAAPPPLLPSSDGALDPPWHRCCYKGIRKLGRQIPKHYFPQLHTRPAMAASFFCRTEQLVGRDSVEPVFEQLHVSLPRGRLDRVSPYQGGLDPSWSEKPLSALGGAAHQTFARDDRAFVRSAADFAGGIVRDHVENK